MRNGTYLRRLMTSMGLVELQVPRAREGGSAGEVLGRYPRRTGDVDAAITEAYVQGVSQRKMATVTEALLGEAVSRSTVSRVTKRLDERIAALRTAPIAEPIAYLYLDATLLEARWARTVEHVAALVAYGVGPDGHRRLLGVALGPSEAEASWSELLTQLVDRGLHGVQLIIADAHKGLAAAVRRWLPEARQHRCTGHLLRNVLTQTPPRLRARLARELRPLFDAPSLAEAKRRLDAVLRRWRPQLPEAMAVLEGGCTAATQFYAVPKAHWLRIRTTNTLERLHGEVQRRVKAVGAFPDRASALRLVTAVALEVTTIWGDRRYLDMTVLEPAAPAAAAAWSYAAAIHDLISKYREPKVFHVFGDRTKLGCITVYHATGAELGLGEDVGKQVIGAYTWLKAVAEHLKRPSIDGTQPGGYPHVTRRWLLEWTEQPEPNRVPWRTRESLMMPSGFPEDSPDMVEDG